MFVGQIGHLAHLNARDTSFVPVSRAPIVMIEPSDAAWTGAFARCSSFGSDFNPDFGRGREEPQPSEFQDGEMFGLSVFLR